MKNMKPLPSKWFALALVVAVSAMAQDKSPEKTAAGLAPVQPPPSMDEPGAPPANVAPVNVDTRVKAIPLANSDELARTAAEESRKAAADAKAAALMLNPPPTKPLESPGLPPEVQAAAEATELPVVTVRQNGADTIQEYRKHGQLYFVRVLSNDGPPKYYVDNPTNVPQDMRQISGPSGRVEPVYFKLLDWK